MLRRYKKGIALLLLLTFAQEIFGPGTVWALTGGPSQPEVNSFEPVGTNQMVDLATGDFNYNIPLMVVPGPNGGYPINLAYHAGIGMEQEASWVGLGWNINPGAITRNLRGVPDDFSGDEIVEELSIKNDITNGISIRTDQFKDPKAKKYFGLDVNTAAARTRINLYYNNYRGLGYSFVANTIPINNHVLKDIDKHNSIVGNVSLTPGFDSQTGLGMNVNYSTRKRTRIAHEAQYKNGYGVGFPIHSREGIGNLRFSHIAQTTLIGNKSKSAANGGSISFASATYTPGGNFSRNGYNVNTSLTIKDKNSWPIFDLISKINYQRIQNGISENSLNIESYGSMYLQNGSDDEMAKLDYNLYNDIPISKRNVNMGLPVMTNDLYTITGQGVAGVFRAHRNDIGSFHDSKTTSKNVSASGATELGIGSSGAVNYLHVGADAPAVLGVSKSYSGKWTDGSEKISSLNFKDGSFYPQFEPFYFKVVGDRSVIETDRWDHMLGENAVAFDMGMKWEGASPKPVVKSNVLGTSNKIEQYPEENSRTKRTQNIEYRTKRDIVQHESFDFTGRPKHIYNEGDYPGTGDPLIGSEIDYTNLGDKTSTTDGEHHIHEYSVLRPDGSRYTYGLPAYNKLQEEVIFSNVHGESGIAKYDDAELTGYDNLDASLDNDEGVENYYSATKIPAYVHAHMLTQITSTDYVDLTDNGPSEDDFGFYAKFNYVEVKDYEWRDPFYDANYMKGNYSNELDDKASYAYGKKDLYYVHSIETKTHVAIFELGDRADGRGVSDPHQKVGTEMGENQKYLKKIILYSKNDPDYGSAAAVPLQTVHFTYDYELCQGIDNNHSSTEIDDPDHVLADQGGKLTLKKVWIEYNGNSKGRLSPYQFSYTSNKSYSRLNVDRWGNYQESISANEHAINPYTRQDLTTGERDGNASAWCLSNISLPSGGDVKISYESDDYGYVQSTRAASMVKIHGFSDTGTTTAPSGADKLKMKKKYLRLWFHADNLEGKTGSERDETVKDYIEGIEEVYFKVYQELKETFDRSEVAKDYVVGYAEIDQESYGADPDNNYGYVDLIKADYKAAGAPGIFSTHPFRKAGWQKLKYSHPDLFNNQADYDSFGEGAAGAAVSVFSSLIGFVEEALSIVALGEYNKYNLLGYCKKINTDKTSFVRLNSPDKLKYGGGHRVKSIILSDNWIEDERVDDHGTIYEYINEDGSTSGVADYEPIVGGEENALKKPIWYNNSNKLLSFQNPNAYVETPISESIYPSPRVVYGRVVSKNISETGIEKSQAGISVNEFYTAKDFPVREDYTKLEHNGYNVPLWIPKVGMLSFASNGYSQGYVVTTNDMSGRPKAQATYPYRNSGTPSGEPVTEVKYRYHTDAKGDLLNNVMVLDAHGEIREALIGVEEDFAIHQAEESNVINTLDFMVNLDQIVVTAPIPFTAPVPTFFDGNFNHSETMYRGVVTNKVIHKTGILKEVEVFSEGSTVVTRNLLYDAETGEPLLTSTDNEWDKPVYNYDYAAHWAYDQMGGAYENYRAKFQFEGSAGDPTILDFLDGPLIPDVAPNEVLTIGDEIAVETGSGDIKTYYVSEVDGASFKLEDETGTTGSFATLTLGTVMRSGRRNLQSVKNGNVVALSRNFLHGESEGLSKQFVLWNDVITGADPQEGLLDPTYFDLNTNSVQVYSWDPTNYYVPNLYNCTNDSYGHFTVDITSTNPDIINFVADGCQNSLTFTPNAAEGAKPGDPEKEYIKAETVADGAGGTVISWTEGLVNFEVISETKDAITGVITSVLFKYLPTGEEFPATWSGATSCWQECEMTDILHAEAVTFSDDWASVYPYADLDEPTNRTGALISSASVNDYKYGKKGTWRPKRTHLYQIARKQSGVTAVETRANIDGEYEPWTPFDWENEESNPNWDWVSEVTRYSPYGYALEEKSRLKPNGTGVELDYDIYSSQIYGYDNSVVTTTSALASYFEIGYTGFEQAHHSADLNNTGHINFTGGTYDVSNDKSHTGTNSLVLSGTQTASFTVEPFVGSGQVLKAMDGKEYVISLWVNVEDSESVGTLSVGGSSVTTNDTREIIDGWKKLEIGFVMDGTAKTITYTSTGQTYIDDVRFGPFDGGMVTYVYDRNNLWLTAELDGLNYATFYNYDSEGNLVQVKKETERGVVTIQTSRSNTKLLP